MDYINDRHHELIYQNKYKYNKGSVEYQKEYNHEYSVKYKKIEQYLDYYKNIDIKNLQEIFAYFHESIYSLVKIYENYYSEPDYSDMSKIFSEIISFRDNLQNTRYTFKMKKSYDIDIIEDYNRDYSKIEVENEPIFKFPFQELIKKLYDYNNELGEVFKSTITLKSYKKDILTWMSNANEEDRKILKDNYPFIKSSVEEIFGKKTKIKKNEYQEGIFMNKDKSIKNKENQEEKPFDKPPKKKNEPKQKFSNKEIKYTFPYKNILLKGVTGTGKSRTLDKIIDNYLNLKNHKDNVLRINIHSASSNADLMQGIAMNSNSDGDIEYKEKKGLVLEFIENATFSPNQPFVLVLEEIQENSLNELIGDLIYLVEDSKRANKYEADNKEYIYSDLVDNIIGQNQEIKSVKLPSLISQELKTKRMVIPENLFIFCTSNYRDDRKVIEDNLLRRFEVIEIYPKYKEEIGDDFKYDEVSNFLKDLNKSIVTVCSDNGEIHPDRFMIGHSIWLRVEDKKAFSRAFLKVITEFKDVKDMHFDDFKKITDKLNFPFDLEKEYESYEEWIKVLQKECYAFLSDK